MECYPPAGYTLVNTGQGALLTTLTSIFEQLLPLLARLTSQQHGQTPLTGQRLQQLQQALLLLGFQLLQSGYCNDMGSATASAKATSSSSKNNNSSSSSSRTSKGLTVLGPEERGQELVSVVMQVAHPSSEGFEGFGHQGQQGLGNYLQQLNRIHNLDVCIAKAIKQVWWGTGAFCQEHHGEGILLLLTLLFLPLAYHHTLLYEDMCKQVLKRQGHVF
jgi:hypothetical protein